MAHSSSSAMGLPSNPRDRPRLLPTNRKLRNLISISLRNVSAISPDSPRAQRVRTTDDDALPQSLKSPSKIVALREQKNLGHSRSSTDLRSLAEDAVVEEAESADAVAIANGSPRANKQKQRLYSTATTSPKRPDLRRMRRRSTLEWANSTPTKRQQRLEDVVSEHLVDTFFTLHVPGLEDAVYISELVDRTMNPTFGHIDWTGCGPGITRADNMILRVWLRRGSTRRWQQLLRFTIDMQGLQYMGKSLESVHRQFPINAVLLHLSDGVYAASSSVIDLLPQTYASSSRPSTSGTSRVSPTSSFDSLLRLARLDDSIQDALSIRDNITVDLEEILHNSEEALAERDQARQAADRLKTIEFATMVVRRQLDKAKKQQEEKRTALLSRRNLMQADWKARGAQADEMAAFQPELPSMSDERNIKQKAVQNQRRRICEELQQCYPIRPQPGKALAFTIRDLHLPNSEDLDSEPPERIAAALGYVVHVLQMLSFYLDHPLPYTMIYRSSTSTIFDRISILKFSSTNSTTAADLKLRTYPLFSKGVPRFRFEYAVFLLNQNVRLLLDNVFGVRVLDIRHTLPNLKYLVYVATAGEGDLPARKAGGVRGLLRAPVMERSGSMDSNTSRLSGLTLASLGLTGNGAANGGKAKTATERLREIDGRG